MNFYKHHLGDYAIATAHLTWDEDMAYSRLIRMYYLHERPIPADVAQACRLVRATTPAQRKAVETVLLEFFTLREDGWHQSRCDKEIADANQKAERNREVGKMGGRPKVGGYEYKPTNNPDGFQNEPNNNPSQTPDTRLQTPDNLNPLVSRADAVPVEQVVMAYNETLGDVLAKAQSLTDARRKHIRARWKEMLGTTDATGRVRFSDADSGVDWFRRFFRKVTTNSHWLGNNDRGWRANLDWIMTPSNFTKILEYVPHEPRAASSTYDRRGQERADTIAGLTGRSTSHNGGQYEFTIDGEAERIG